MLGGNPSRPTEMTECEGKGEGNLEWVAEERDDEVSPAALGLTAAARAVVNPTNPSLRNFP